jgi:cell division protein FtsI (penicillin-binding protein 3)
MVQFAERLTPREQYEALRDAGFGMTTGVPYPSESSGRLRPVPQWSGTSQASLAMGYEISVTPLQLAAAYAAIANGGELLEPQLVKEIRAPDGAVTDRASGAWCGASCRRARRACATCCATWWPAAPRPRRISRRSSWRASRARRVARAPDGRGYEAGSYTASFVGLFPAEAPQIVILVKLDDPSGAYYGGRTAAPVTKVVLEAAIAARDAALDRRRLAEVPKRAASLPCQRSPTACARPPAARVAEAERLRRSCSWSSGAARGAGARDDARAVPDVRGLADARRGARAAPRGLPRAVAATARCRARPRSRPRAPCCRRRGRPAGGRR